MTTVGVGNKFQFSLWFSMESFISDSAFVGSCLKSNSTIYTQPLVCT
jgi:hypothetical protein